MKKVGCRRRCGACCIAPSISSPMPGMPQGKPAGVRCLHLTGDSLCALYGNELRPEVCASLQPDEEWCGMSRSDALMRITAHEAMTV